MIHPPEDPAPTAMKIAVWERLSRHYDRQRWLEVGPVRCMLTLVAPKENERLLDVATGTGVVLRVLASRHEKPREAVGIDATPGMLAKVPPLPGGWSLHVADAVRLPFANDTFDVLTASYLLHLLPQPDFTTVLCECRRVLRPGGRLAVLTPAIPPWPGVRGLAQGMDRLARRGPERYCGLRALDPRASLAEAGFEVLTARYSLLGYPSICVLAASQ